MTVSYITNDNWSNQTCPQTCELHWDCCQPQDPGSCANIYTKSLWLPSSPLCAMNNHATSKSLTREFDFGTKLTWFTVKNNELVTKKQKLLQATQQVLHMCPKEINQNSSEHNPSLESVSVSDSSNRWKKFCASDNIQNDHEMGGQGICDFLRTMFRYFNSCLVGSSMGGWSETIFQVFKI